MVFKQQFSELFFRENELLTSFSVGLVLHPPRRDNTHTKPQKLKIMRSRTCTISDQRCTT